MTIAETDDPSKKYGVENQSDRAHQLIRDGILTSHFPQGMQLNERMICEQFNLSRTPVRYAFARLTSEGLVKQIRNIGVFVRKLTDRERVELMETRRVFEAGAAALVAEKASEEQLAELLALAADADAHREAGSSEPLLAREKLFHQKVIDLAGNSEMARMYTNIHAIFLTLTVNGKANFRTPVFSHSEIARAIASRDTEKAFSIMWSHLGEALNSFRETLKNQQD